MDNFYHTVATTCTVEFKDRGSKFIGYVFPIVNKEDAKLLVKGLKEEHPKANHHCFAYRIGFDGNEYRVTDDGEPGGTAGRPILGQIDSASLTNVLIVVVRYFGGTMLGVPGLINAYKTTAALALQNTTIVKKERLANFQLSFDYTQMNDIQKTIKQHQALVTDNQSGLFCTFIVAVPLSTKAAFVDNISRYYQIEVKELI